MPKDKNGGGKMRNGKNGKKYRFHYDQKVPLLHLTTELHWSVMIGSIHIV